MLLSNDAKQIDHIFCVCSFTEVGSGSEWAPGRSVSVCTVEHPRLHRDLLCTAQHIRVLLALPIQSPVPASGCAWNHRKPQSVSQDLVEKRAVGWVVGRDTLTKPSHQWHRDSSAQRLRLCLRCVAGVCVCGASPVYGFPAGRCRNMF